MRLEVVASEPYGNCRGSRHNQHGASSHRWWQIGPPNFATVHVLLRLVPSLVAHDFRRQGGGRLRPIGGVVLGQ